MSKLDDLAQVAEELRALGIDASHNFLYGPHGCLEGLEVSGEFYPLWELTLPENQDHIAGMNFDAIKARREVGWTIEPPRLRYGRAS
jgi:hypothetical protein